MKVILKTLLAVFTGLILQANMFSVEAAEELRLPEPDRFTSDGGIRAIYIEDELPLCFCLLHSDTAHSMKKAAAPAWESA